MAAACGAVSSSETDMDVEERPSFVQREVANQRQEFGLARLVRPQVRVLMRIKIANLRIADRPDSIQMTGRQRVLAGKGIQALHHFLPGMKREEISCRLTLA